MPNEEEDLEKWECPVCGELLTIVDDVDDQLLGYRVDVRWECGFCHITGVDTYEKVSREWTEATE